VIKLAGFSPDSNLDVKERDEYLSKITTEFLCFRVLKTRTGFISGHFKIQRL